MSPRANDGTVTLVAGNPVVADTDIVTTWANPTISDLASMAQDSLSRSGKGGMLVPFQNTDGTVSAPGIAFTNAAGTGFFRTATTLAVAWVGVIKASFAAALARFYTPVQMDSTLLVTGVATFTGTPVLTNGITGITRTNLPTVGQVVSAASTGLYSLTATAWSTVTNSTMPALVTTGRPVCISAQSFSGTVAQWYAKSTAATGFASIRIVRTTAGTPVVLHTISWAMGASPAIAAFINPGFVHIDVVAAGSHIYSLEADVPDAGNTIHVTNTQLVAFEL